MKILVTYATRAGSTAEVAAAIGRVIGGGNGCQVDVRPVQEVADLSPCQAAVVGSGIRGGRWLPEAVRFVEQRREELAQMRVAYFLVCLTLKADSLPDTFGISSALAGLRATVVACRRSYACA